ncbi:ABC transporter ATP-binding protein [Microvirga sp. 3-52]|uniref:dipeptide ABC transporter ATP-binding protein n=1 Tax=Microvirga sp. 3-52 TaxID=2792425 RepID=UPI001AC3AF85|nr:ABC transporter ATP-binding protein [Microvirga sp. 3-52]MBO1907199.1 ABC transporter ATP-binding protein [Microvirga sp. 3-52]MBS7454201.1 ABC transporter ATP-binding protein [Microvirga sp. 3-52]
MSTVITFKPVSTAHSNAPVLEIGHLAVGYRGSDGFQRVVHDVSLRVRPGEVVALVGESGSGKTTTAQAVIGLLAENGRLEAGAVRLNGTDIAGWSQKQLDTIRGSKISLIPQDPTSSLNPVKTIGAQVAEVLQIHRRGSRAEIDARVVELLARVGLSRPELRAKQYSHELSGGMRQRVLIAIAIALRPALIIADEPTSALDVTVQKRILDLIDELRREYGTAVLLVTHDLGVAADRANHIVVLKGGRIQEQGPTSEILASPRSEYTRKLLADAPSLGKIRAVPRARSPRIRGSDDAIVVQNLVQDFSVGGRREAFRAVDDVSFTVQRGTTHAIVGESGSGKTTTARGIVGFQKPTSGRILVDGVDVTTLRGENLRRFRKTIQLVYQNPFASLDPQQTIFQIVEEPLLNFDPLPRDDRARKVHAILERVGLPQSVLTRKPRALSGGQRQRVAIARALVLDPQVLVLDEAVSALDVTVQAQILELLEELQQALGLTYLFISHDLAVVRQISDTVSVLHNGRQVDSGLVEDVFLRPGSAYTRELISAIPGQRNVSPR